MAAGAATCAAVRDRRPGVGGSVLLLCGPRGLGGIVRPFFVWSIEQMEEMETLGQLRGLMEIPLKQTNRNKK